MKKKAKIGYAVKHESRGYLSWAGKWTSIGGGVEIYQSKADAEEEVGYQRKEKKRMNPAAISVVPLFISDN